MDLFAALYDMDTLNGTLFHVREAHSWIKLCFLLEHVELFQTEADASACIRHATATGEATK